VAVELAVLATATIAFLRTFPDRPMWVDLTLALLALTLLLAGSGYTRRAIWSHFPPERGHSDRRGSWIAVAGFTALAELVLLAIGAADAFRDGGLAAVSTRLPTPRPLIAALLYLPWALAQQTLFQFYLLGRLRALFPARAPAAPVVLTGLAYALVHLPDPVVATVTAASGICWTYAYHRFRVLGSIAVSHALLGSTFYYWVYDRDLLAGMARFVRSWL